MIRFVGCRDVDRRNIQGPVFAEKGDALCLKQVSTYGIYCYRIGSDDKPLVRPDVSPVKKVGSFSIKLGREGAKDVQTGLAFYNGVRPDLAQGRAPIALPDATRRKSLRVIIFSPILLRLLSVWVVDTRRTYFL